MKKIIFLFIAMMGIFAISAKEKDVLCVYGFSYSSGVGSNYAEMLRSAIIEGINKTQRVTIIDAENEDVIKAELSRRSQESAVNDDNALLDAMKTLGANYALTGHLASLTTTSKSTSNGTRYSAKVVFQIKVYNLSDGSTVANESFESTSSFLSSHTTADDARSEAVGYGSLKMEDFINKYFLVTGTILEVAEVKKDDAKKVYIDLGPGLGVTKGQKFNVCEVKTVAGRKINKTIGEIKLEEVEADDLSLCKVTKNGKAIQAAILEGKTLVVETKVDTSIF